MNNHTVAETNGDEAKNKTDTNEVVVEINDQPVMLRERRPTGAEIKSAAIAQGVPIQLGYQLILKRPGESSKVIGDDEPVTIHKGMVFRAIPADDNS